MFKIMIIILSLFVLSLQASESKKFSQEQLDQMMAPIALYPDALLSQILMASTYNKQLQEAIKYAKEHTQEKGDEAVKKVQDKGWDASVSSLMAFPQVLDMLGKKPDWTKELGNAFLAEPSEVMDTVQKLRKKAVDHGNLKTTTQQTVKKDDSNSTEIIEVAPATQTVYVPVYNPAYVYGQWWYAYPPYYYYPPYYRPLPGVMIGFGVGIVVTNALWGGFGWHNHSTYINVNHYNHININKISGNGNRVNWKEHKKRDSGKKFKSKPSTKEMQRKNARKAMDNKGLNLDKQRKNLGGTKGDNLRKNLNGGKFQSSSHLDAFSGLDKPKRIHNDTSRGNFSRGNHSRGSGGFSHGGGGFSRGGGGFSRAGGGMRGRR